MAAFFNTAILEWTHKKGSQLAPFVVVTFLEIVARAD